MAVRTRVNRDVDVGLHSLELAGHLTVPEGATGVVLFVLDPRIATPVEGLAHRFVDAGLATLDVDLIAADERGQGVDGTAPDTELLAVRVLAVTRWLRAHPDTHDRSVAYFGVGAGADVALLAAAEDSTVAALVVRNGRPDLVASRVSAVRTPTLLVVDSTDGAVVAANRDAARVLRCEHAIVIVPDASDHAGVSSAIDAIAHRSIEWFSLHLRAGGRSDATTVRDAEAS
jgi:dienelactone hydrolase